MLNKSVAKVDFNSYYLLFSLLEEYNILSCCLLILVIYFCTQFFRILNNCCFDCVIDSLIFSQYVQQQSVVFQLICTYAFLGAFQC